MLHKSFTFLSCSFFAVSLLLRNRRSRLDNKAAEKWPRLHLHLHHLHFHLFYLLVLPLLLFLIPTGAAKVLVGSEVFRLRFVFQMYEFPLFP